jgi:uncharacterized protein (DUF1810 family)
MPEPDLQRFVSAQDRDGTYERALAELRAGRKRSHWMWFVFPQVAGLGTSAMSQAYAINSLDEAIAYLQHSILGPRLREATEALLAAPGSAVEILGEIDAVKLRSSMTLFQRAAETPSPYAAAIDKFFGGEADPLTTRILDS